MSTRWAILAFLTLGGWAAAQQKPAIPKSKPSPEGLAQDPVPRAKAPNIHAAWLQEVLDLETGRAMKSYRQLATDDTAQPLDRQIAVARLYELRRLGVGTNAPPPDLQVLPKLLQDHFRANQEPAGQLGESIEAEVQAGKGDAEAVRTFFDKGEEVELRPLVVATVLAAREDPSRRPQRYYYPWRNSPARVLDRIRANDIVRAELNGNRQASEQLKRQAFPNWQPQKWPEDKDIAWQTVRENLQEWRNQRQLKPAERELLRRLQTVLESDARRGPENALNRLDRMPLYFERLRVGLDR